MMRRIFFSAVRVLPAVSVLLLAAPLMAESAAGIVQARGNVSINGKAVPESSTLFNGDRILTSGPDSGANLLANGQHMMVMGNSNVTYAQNDVHVACGRLLVTLPASAMAHVNGVTFKASVAGVPARIEFRQWHGNYQILDHEGSISYDNGSGGK